MVKLKEALFPCSALLVIVLAALSLGTIATRKQHFIDLASRFQPGIYPTAAAASLRAAGSNAIPYLVVMLRTHEPLPHYVARSLFEKIPMPVRGSLGLRVKKVDYAAIRCSAARAIASIGPSAYNAEEGLFGTLRDDEFQVKLEAATALASLGPSGELRLAQALTNSSLTVRRAAASGLSTCATGDPLVFELLVRALADEDAQVRIFASAAFKAYGTNLLPEMLRDLNSPLAATRKGATRCVAISRLPRKIAEPILLACLEDTDPGCRTEAMRGLASLTLPGPAIVAALGAGLQDKSPETRILACSALRSYPYLARPVVPQLTLALADESPEVREISASTLGGMGAPALAAVAPLKAMTRYDTNERVRLAANVALSKIRP